MHSKEVTSCIETAEWLQSLNAQRTQEDSANENEDLPHVIEFVHGAMAEIMRLEGYTYS